MAPSSSCHDSEVKHDVFISFRGTDVRKGLLSHLKKALRCRHIDTYVDEKLERGDEISPSLLTAIKESQILLVIFSKDYASSKWCLEELAEMIECMEKYKRVLLPVFFNLDPSHVRNQLGEYGDALAKHEETLRENLLKVQSWRSALNKAGHLSGFHYPTNYEDESDLVDKIVEVILEKLSRFGPSESNGLVGINQNIALVQSLLLMESSEVRFVGIWGMGGIGKTTIARDIYDKYSLQYDGCCILNVREDLEKQELRLLRERLISELLEGEGLHTSGISKARYISSAIRRLTRKKVFIVLDDVNTSEQLKKLVREDISFGPGSRVIITSRDRHVLTSGGVDQIHEVKKLDPQDSLKLFCLNAFNECHPKMGYEKLSEEVVKIAQGNPLALEVLGSDFHSRSSIETWTCALNKIRKYPHEKVQRGLRFSYDELHDVEKKAFLDIAFFFNKEDKDYVIRQLDYWGFHGACGIEVLQQKALITISYDNRIQIHDLIREMGLEIVRQESPEYPERRSRLRDSEDVYNVLRNNLGNNKVEAMQIDVTSQFVDLLPLNVDTFKKMPRLRFLKFNYPLHAELCMQPSLVKELLQDFVDSKGRDVNKSNMVKRGHNFLRMQNLHALMLYRTFERVQKDSPKYLEIRSRLRDGEDVYHELRNNQGTVEVETMQIDVTSEITDLLPLNIDTSKKLSHLRFRKFNHPLDAELSMPPSRVKALLQDIDDSKRRDLNRSNVSVVLPQFKSWDSADDLVNSSSIEGSRSKQFTELTDLTKGSNLEKEYLSECESCCDADEPILSLEKQVASLLSGCEDLKNIASEIHIKCLHYFAVDGWSGPEEFSVTSKETKQLSITHPQPGMEILNSSIGYLSNVDESDVVHVDDEPFKNMPKDLLCLRCTDYLKLSKSTEQDTQKPKLHILFDGLKVYKGIISFHHDHHVFEDLACIPLRVFSWIDKIVGVPLKISVLSWCREFIVEEHHAKMLREVLPRGPKVRITTFRR